MVGSEPPAPETQPPRDIDAVLGPQTLAGSPQGSLARAKLRLFISTRGLPVLCL